MSATQPEWVPTRRQAVKIALWYALLGVVWISASGIGLHAIVRDPTLAARLEEVKGWFFICFTASLLGLVLNRYFRILRDSILRARENEARLQILGDNLPDAYVYQYTQGLDGIPLFRYVSAGVERIHGIPAARVLKDPGCLSDQVEPDERESSVSREMESARTLTDLVAELKIRRSDGERRILEIRSRPRPGQKGTTEWYGVAADVTRIRQAQEEAEAGRDRLKLFIEHAPGAVAMFDTEMRYLAVSPRWMTDFRLGGASIVGRSHYDVFPELTSDMKWVHRRALAGEVMRGSEDPFTRADGAVQWLTWEAQPWRVSEDVIGGIIIFNEDVTERRRTAEALRQSEEQFRAMFEVASIGMGQADPFTARMLRVNRKLCEITGYSESELLGMTTADLTHPDDRAADAEALRDLVAGKRSSHWREKRYVRKDGRIAWVSVNMTVVRNPDGTPNRTIATIEEITGRRQAEEERLRLAAAMEQAAESICITDTQAHILYVNPAFERTTGYSRDEALGLTPKILKSGKHDAAYYQQMWGVLKRGEVWRGHFINQRKDGSLFEEEAAISPVRDQTGAITNYVAIKLDVTREIALEEQVRQVQKLEAIGQLAGGVAHDFNNILAVILMQTEQALDEPDRSAVQGALADIKQAAERAASLTRQLLLFSRRQVMQTTTLDMNEIVTNLAKMLQRILGEDVHLRIDLVGKPLWIRADAGMIDQVLMNLSVNARDAMPSGGRLTVSTEERRFTAADAGRNRHAQPGSYCCLSILDSGSGIAPEILPKIFEPFFTTKEPGKGTGLGLATVYGIVEQHKGWVEVSSEMGQGTTFMIFLPMIAAEERREDAPRKQRAPGGSETILLVEDDVEVRRVTKRILERYGYRVEEAGHGRDALGVLQKVDNRIDLLMTDMVLPEGMHGREVAIAIRALVPGEAFMQKPFEFQTLLTTVRQCLDATDTSRGGA